MPLLIQNTPHLLQYQAWLNANGFAGNSIFPLDQGNYNYQAVLEAMNFRIGFPFNDPLPIEWHPYLANNPIDIRLNKLLIGTFPTPNWWAAQTIPPILHPPGFNFFHGNVGSLWQLLAQANGIHQVINNTEDAIELLNTLNMNYSDIICATQRIALNGFDNNLKNIQINNDLIEKIMLPDSKIEKLGFTNACAFGAGLKLFLNGSVKVDRRDALSLFLRGIQELNLNLEIQIPTGNWLNVNAANRLLIQDIFKNIIHFNIRVTRMNIVKTFQIFGGLSPNNQALMAIGNNPLFLNWLIANPIGTPAQFRIWVWSNF
jgi:hypothetical protein